jgi:hypothetical protein
MGQPIGYYCNHLCGDATLLGQIERAWGSRLEALNKSELLWVLSSLCGVIVAEATENYDPYNVGDGLEQYYERFHELDFDDQVGLAKTILSQL